MDEEIPFQLNIFDFFFFFFEKVFPSQVSKRFRSENKVQIMHGIGQPQRPPCRIRFQIFTKPTSKLKDHVFYFLYSRTIKLMEKSRVIRGIKEHF